MDAAGALTCWRLHILAAQFLSCVHQKFISDLYQKTEVPFVILKAEMQIVNHELCIYCQGQRL